MATLNLAPPVPSQADSRATVDDQPTLELYTAFARRHSRLLVACICIGLLLGGVWTLMQPRSYSATASVVLSPVPSHVSTATSGRLPREVTIDTDAQLVRSPSVLTAVSESVNEDSGTVLEHLRVTAVPLSRVLEITYTTDSATEAATAATVAAESFVTVRRSTLGSLQRDQLDHLLLRIDELQDRLDAEAQRRPFVSPDDPLVSEIALLRDRFTQLELAQATPAELTDRAEAPSSANSSNAEVPATSGVMMGLLAGCLVGGSLDRRRAGRVNTGRR